MGMKLKDSQSGLAQVAVITVVVLVLVAAGFAGWKVWDGGKTTAPPTSTEKQSQAQVVEEKKQETTGTVITTGDSKFGTMLFDGNGQAIYIWELEESTKAECYGDCAKAWPPVLSNGAPRATGSAKNELLGTTKRTDGSTQVTYNGHPLYYYAHEKPGEVKCHNISTHGGLWWVLQPNGIRAD
jgi:predicted lipoprotein with Yx(FWY)xxD motif